MFNVAPVTSELVKIQNRSISRCFDQFETVYVFMAVNADSMEVIWTRIDVLQFYISFRFRHVNRKINSVIVRAHCALWLIFAMKCVET